MRIAILKGDGIGPEIVEAAQLVLDKVNEKYDLGLVYQEALFGGAAYDVYGNPYPPETQEIVKRCDAVLLGAVGAPKYDSIEPSTLRPEGGLLAIRKSLGLYCNIRPIKYYDFLADRVIWKKGLLDGLDLIICRELTGGLYFGKRERNGDSAFDTMSYSRFEIERIVRDAFEMAKNRDRKLLHSIDKANVLDCSRLWREVVNEIAAEYPEVHVEHLYVDNAAMQLIVNPKQFDVIVTENMFGDILSDESAALGGSLGMLPSASLGGEISLFEPSHGSAPDIAGQGVANPIATILSAAMLLRFAAKHETAARAIEASVNAVLADNIKTPDLADAHSKVVSTMEMAEEIAARI